jgi:DNA polymerase-3 subunit delta
MKFYSQELPKLIKLIEKNEIKVIVFHGPNQGFISTAIKQIKEKFNYITVNYNYKDLSCDKLAIITNTRNFFNQNELIKISGVAGSINKETKEFLVNYDNDNLLCFIANDSLPPGGIRKFFEDHPNLAVLACYYDNEHTITKIILQQCSKRFKTIEEDALFYLKSHLKGDHQIIKSELEKIFCYTHDKKIISKEDVKSCLSFELSASGDEMCIYFAKKDHLKFLREVTRLRHQNINEVLIIRSLLRYFLNIYIASLKIENGENENNSIKSLPTPIFYKYIDDFKQILNKYSSKDAIKAINILQDAEVDFKSRPKSFNLFFSLLRI